MYFLLNYKLYRKFKIVCNEEEKINMYIEAS